VQTGRVFRDLRATPLCSRLFADNLSMTIGKDHHREMRQRYVTLFEYQKSLATI
jgi:hypothetical protein